LPLSISACSSNNLVSPNKSDDDRPIVKTKQNENTPSIDNIYRVERKSKDLSSTER